MTIPDNKRITSILIGYQLGVTTQNNGNINKVSHIPKSSMSHTPLIPSLIRCNVYKIDINNNSNDDDDIEFVLEPICTCVCVEGCFELGPVSRLYSGSRVQSLWYQRCHPHLVTLSLSHSHLLHQVYSLRIISPCRSIIYSYLHLGHQSPRPLRRN